MGAHGSAHVIEGEPEGPTETAAAPQSASLVGGEQKRNLLCGSGLLVSEVIASTTRGSTRDPTPVGSGC
jgi:hypothetical protein